MAPEAVEESSVNRMAFFLVKSKKDSPEKATPKMFPDAVENNFCFLILKASCSP